MARFPLEKCVVYLIILLQLTFITGRSAYHSSDDDHDFNEDDLQYAVKDLQKKNSSHFVESVAISAFLTNSDIRIGGFLIMCQLHSALYHP